MYSYRIYVCMLLNACARAFVWMILAVSNNNVYTVSVEQIYHFENLFEEWWGEKTAMCILKCIGNEHQKTTEDIRKSLSNGKMHSINDSLLRDTALFSLDTRSNERPSAHTTPCTMQYKWASDEIWKKVNLFTILSTFVRHIQWDRKKAAHT